ncbi:MAG TPA: hypothetical protein VF385_01995, partial [Patescibacteria group bacterium]
YVEHEIDYIYVSELKKLPTPNFDFAYGFSLIDKNKIFNSKFLFAPWVKQMIKIIQINGTRKSLK